MNYTVDIFFNRLSLTPIALMKNKRSELIIKVLCFWPII